MPSVERNRANAYGGFEEGETEELSEFPTEDSEEIRRVTEGFDGRERDGGRRRTVSSAPLDITGEFSDFSDGLWDEHQEQQQQQQQQQPGSAPAGDRQMRTHEISSFSLEENLDTMDFTTKSDAHGNEETEEILREEHPEQNSFAEDTDSFLDYANGPTNGKQRVMSSFLSDSQQQQSKQQPRRALPKRPESYHDYIHRSEHPSIEEEQAQLPTFDSPMGTANIASDVRLARLVARYATTPGDSSKYGESEAMTLELPEIADTPEVSQQQASVADVVGARGVDRSIVARTRDALQQRMANDVEHQDGPYGEMRRRFLAGGASSNNVDRQEPFTAASAYSLQNQSLESLEHPNMGSQETPEQSMQSMPDLYSNSHAIPDTNGFSPFGSHMVHSFGNSPEFDAFEPVNASEVFTPADDADLMFGDRPSVSSRQTWSDIVRDHEQVFSDLIDELDQPTTEGGRPPESLFASSASIVAAMQKKRYSGQQQRKVSTWDGREATIDALRAQEQRFGGAGRLNPIEMLDKANSLGMEDEEEVSGVLPEAEYSPEVVKPSTNRHVSKQVPAFRGRSQTGLTLDMNRGKKGHLPGPFTAPMNGYSRDNTESRDAPPPTTPTTFISRDTRHRPSSRVLHQVPPFDLRDLRSFNDMPKQQPQQQPQQQAQPQPQPQPQVPQTPRGKRPAGPRALDSNSLHRPPSLNVRQHKPLFAPMVTYDNDDDDTHGLGSLLQDSLTISDVSRVSRTPASLGRLLATSSSSPYSRAPGNNKPLLGVQNKISSYEPFQDPTVDVSRLPHYREVGQQQKINVAMVSERRLDGGHLPDGYGSDEMVGTVRYDSLTPSGGSLASLSLNESMRFEGEEQEQEQEQEQAQDRRGAVRQSPNPVQQAVAGEPGGPTLRDIYDLLKKTASSLGSQGHQSATTSPNALMAKHGSAASFTGEPSKLRTDHVSDQGGISFEAQRPSAPTPRRAQQIFSRFANEPAMEDSPEIRRVRQHLPRYVSDTAAGDNLRRPMFNMPSRERRASAAVQTDHDARLRAEMQKLQDGLLAKFDEYRAEVDALRTEVRRKGSANSAQRVQDEPEVGPMDSVSMVQATSSPGQPKTSPMHAPPSTARNRRQHMVQWLSSQDAMHSDPVGSFSAPVSGRRSRQDPEIPPAAADRGFDDICGPKKASQVAPQEEDCDSDGDGDLSDTTTTVPDYVPRGMATRSPLDPAMINPAGIPSRKQLRGKRPSCQDAVDGDLLGRRQTLDSLRRRSHRPDSLADSLGDVAYTKGMAQQLADTLGELQRVHRSHFHQLGTKRESMLCPVCESLEAQNHDPYLFGRHAVAYKSLSTRQLQALLNAYVAAMEDEFASGHKIEPEVYHSFTPSKKHASKRTEQQLRRKLSNASVKDSGGSATRVVIELLREELDALSRRYHRMVDEYHRLNPTKVADQRRRRHMARELKDLVDLLDVKGEQIAVLAALHPQPSANTDKYQSSGSSSGSGGRKTSKDKSRRKAFWDSAVFDMDDSSKEPRRSGAEHAFQKARELQLALGDLY
ncbi:hypothetical protein H4R99_006749 [Coemansia sp. RSA 1722]|nr:hypothetical protein LPJ57_002088 [Coemansia sp. RSA 486]KAJ2237342.1 hypothetical protein IWW45_001028 [Coemansia sp. RSA 485]KAJ2591447.1 hypothetical protein H4R99_006749 [Coemansia sp. RSA 1722]